MNRVLILVIQCKNPKSVAIEQTRGESKIKSRHFVQGNVDFELFDSVMHYSIDAVMQAGGTHVTEEAECGDVGVLVTAR